jgi:hypothetical protein
VSCACCANRCCWWSVDPFGQSLTRQCSTSLSEGQCQNNRGSVWTPQATCPCPAPSCVNQSFTVVYPVTVYRTGGLPVPGNCTPTVAGFILDRFDFTTVYGGYSATYSSVEAQAKDYCGKCVFYGNNFVNGGTAAIYISGFSLQPNFPFGGGGSWCNNPMCNPLP